MTERDGRRELNGRMGNRWRPHLLLAVEELTASFGCSRQSRLLQTTVNIEKSLGGQPLALSFEQHVNANGLKQQLSNASTQQRTIGQCLTLHIRGLNEFLELQSKAH